MALGCLALTFATSGALVWRSLQSTVTPYVVEVDETGAATAIANVGPGLGPEIGPAGNFSALPDSAKWVLGATMLLGRLELLAVFVLFTPAFWRG